MKFPGPNQRFCPLSCTLIILLSFHAKMPNKKGKTNTAARTRHAQQAAADVFVQAVGHVPSRIYSRHLLLYTAAHPVPPYVRTYSGHLLHCLVYVKL
jgi:hypothetical protein